MGLGINKRQKTTSPRISGYLKSSNGGILNLIAGYFGDGFSIHISLYIGEDSFILGPANAFSLSVGFLPASPPLVICDKLILIPSSAEIVFGTMFETTTRSRSAFPISFSS